MKKRKADDITKCGKCFAYYSRSHAKEFGHTCSELIAGLVNVNGKKRKAESCVWKKQIKDSAFFRASCNLNYTSQGTDMNGNCPLCLRKVEVKK